MFIDPKVGMMSAIMPPSMIGFMPLTMAKHGGRMRMRYGVPEPSLTM